MNVLRLLSRLIRTTDLVSPRLAGRLAARLWFTPPLSNLHTGRNPGPIQRVEKQPLDTKRLRYVRLLWELEGFVGDVQEGERTLGWCIANVRVGRGVGAHSHQAFTNPVY